MQTDCASAPQGAMHPTRIEMRNFKTLEACTIVPGARRLVMIVGPNGAGKTTALDAFSAVLFGKRGCPEAPIKAGQTEASIRLEIGVGGAAKYEVIRSWRREGDGHCRTWLSLYDVSSGERKPVGKPQTVLDELTSPVAFDPSAFLRAKPDEQIKLLLTALGREAAQAYRENRELQHSTYVARGEVNRQVKELRTRLDTELADPSPTSELLAISEQDVRAELGRVQAGNAERQRIERDCETLAQQLREIEDSIALLQQRAEKTRANLAAARKRSAEAPAYASADAIVTRLRDIEQHNARVKQQQRSRQAQAELSKLEAASQKATGVLASLDRDLERMVAASALGEMAPGLAMRGGTLLLDGVPFEQGSGRQRRACSAAIGMALNPQFRMMRIDEADGIDDEGLAHFAELAKANNCSLWLAGVRLSAACLPESDLEVVQLDRPQETAAASVGADASELDWL